MSWFRHNVVRADEAAPWEGPFAPAPSSEAATFDRMVRTAGELVAQGEGRAAQPAQPGAASVAA